MNPQIKEWIEIAGYPSVVAGLLALLWRYLLLPSKKFMRRIKSNSQATLDAWPVLLEIAQRWPEVSGSRSFLTEHDKLADDVVGLTERLYAILDLSPAAVYECNTDGKCTHANKALCDLFGLDRLDMMGSGWLEAVHPDDREKTFDAWMNALVKGIPYEAEYWVRHVDTKKLTQCAAVAYPLMRQGAIIAYFGRVTPIDGTIPHGATTPELV